MLQARGSTFSANPKADKKAAQMKAEKKKAKELAKLAEVEVKAPRPTKLAVGMTHGARLAGNFAHSGGQGQF